MIKRSDDFNCFDDETLNNIKKAIDNKSQLLDIIDDEKNAINKNNEFNILGYNTEIIPMGDKFKIVAKKQQLVDLREAKNSGNFKKLAWGRYYFTKENKLGDKKYDFDDGSIWKVITDENGTEYLTKEIDDDNNEVIRTKANDDYLNDDNYQKFAKILNIDTKEGSVISMMENTGMKKEINKFINTTLESEISKKIKNNKFIETAEFNNDVKSLLITSVNNNVIKENKDIDNLIKSYNEKMITKTNNFSIFK